MVPAEAKAVENLHGEGCGGLCLNTFLLCGRLLVGHQRSQYPCLYGVCVGFFHKLLERGHLHIFKRLAVIGYHRDGHCAALCGLALELSQAETADTVYLIFQPGEELCPGGANILVQKGLLEKYDIKRIVGMHVSSELPTGKFLFGSGYLMAATNELYIRFHGVGGHAAIPQKRSDTVLALADFLVNVHKMQESLIDDMPFVVAFGKIVGDGALNVVPPETSADGTMRTFNPVLHRTIEENLKRISEESAAKYKCTAELEIRKGYPAVYNNPEVTKVARSLAAEYVSESNIDEMPLKMTAEDFAYYSEKIPATFFRAGIMGNGRGEVTQHNPKFDMDEEVFHTTSGLMAYIALNLTMDN